MTESLKSGKCSVLLFIGKEYKKNLKRKRVILRNRGADTKKYLLLGTHVHTIRQRYC